MEQVKCSDCGFLAMRHNGTRQLVEAEKVLRDDGAVPEISQCEKVPICFHLAIDFRSHMPQNASSCVRNVIQTERACADFTPWRQGYSPKEHQEMLDRQWMVKFQTERDDADRKWRQECDDRDRQWRERQAHEEREWREGQDRIATRRHRQNLGVMGFAAILIALLGTIVGSMIQAGWVQKPSALGAQSAQVEPAPASIP